MLDMDSHILMGGGGGRYGGKDGRTVGMNGQD